MADFVLGRLKFHFKGSWTTGTFISKDDVLTYGGNAFVCKVKNFATRFLHRLKSLSNI